MKSTEEEDYEYLDEKQVKSLITRLVFEVEKLKDENESLWFLLELGSEFQLGLGSEFQFGLGFRLGFGLEY